MIKGLTTIPAAQLLTQPQREERALNFPIPVEDFAIHDLDATQQRLAQDSAAILFCIEGQATLTLQPGESCFVSASDGAISATRSGRLARVFNVTG
ncbi:putative Mannose-6-phosphate isomerase|nr:putative Mannose-6-phosphate isomerase [Candidatus Pantoea persica]